MKDLVLSDGLIEAALCGGNTEGQSVLPGLFKVSVF